MHEKILEFQQGAKLFRNFPDQSVPRKIDIHEVRATRYIGRNFTNERIIAQKQHLKSVQMADFQRDFIVEAIVRQI